MGLELLFQGNQLNRLLHGLWITAEIAFISVFFACFFGIILGVLMTSKNNLIKAITGFYLEFVRLIPIISVVVSCLFWISKMV